MINNIKIPKYVTHVTETIQKKGFEAFLVGGCVRDLIIGREPKDWDITTNAKPEDLISMFEKTVYENTFGTVAVCIPKEDFVTCETREGVTHRLNPADDLSKAEDINVSCETKYHIIEVTPYRTETTYTDFRHPDEVCFSEKIEDDLKRRDFTINAMAYNPAKGHLIDIYKGQEDIKDKVIRAVGDPVDRFTEDALRMLRAVRFASELNFIVSHETMMAIIDKKDLIKNISKERIRDEFTKIIKSNSPSLGIVMLQKLGLLGFIVPELEEGIDCEQGGAHKYDVFQHLLGALDHAKDKGWGLEIRLAALFHDIGKPKSRRFNKQSGQTTKTNPNYEAEKPVLEWSGPSSSLVRGPSKKGFSAEGYSKKPYTFYGHEVVGERITQKIMERLKYPKKTTDLVVSLVRNHMFFSDTEAITLSAVRRIVQKVGKEHIWDLMNVRECDRVGMAKAEAPYRLRKYHAMIEEVLRDPISVGQLAIDGNYLMEVLHVKPSPRMGWILNALLEEVLEDPTKNTKEILSSLVEELNKLDDKELKKLGEKGKEKKEELEEKEIEKLHKKHGV